MSMTLLRIADVTPAILRTSPSTAPIGANQTGSCNLDSFTRTILRSATFRDGENLHDTYTHLTLHMMVLHRWYVLGIRELGIDTHSLRHPVPTRRLVNASI